MAVILPYFFLPWSLNRAGIDNLNKSYLLWLIVPVILAMWWYSGLRQGEYRVRWSPLAILLFSFCAVMALAATFGLDTYISFFGSPGSGQSPLFTLLSLCVLYLVLSNIFTNKAWRGQFISAMIWSFTAGTGIVSVLLLLGWTKILPVGSPVYQVLRMAVGTLEYWSIYLSVMAAAVFGIFLSPDALVRWLPKRSARLFAGGALLASFFQLVLFNFIPAWICFGAGIAAAYLSVNLAVPKISRTWRGTNRTVIMVVVAGLFLFMDISALGASVTTRRLAGQLQLGLADTSRIAGQAFLSRPLLGFGSEHFSTVFSRFRPTDFNNSPFWYVRFNGGASYLLDILVSAGVLGIAAYLSVLFYLIIRFRRWYRQKSPESGQLTGFLSGSLAALIAGQIVFAMDITLLFLFFVFIAIVESLNYEKESDPFFLINHGSYRVYYGAVLGALILFSAWFGTDIWLLRHWAAVYYYSVGIGDPSAAIEHPANLAYLNRAIDLNPYIYQYQLAAAKYYKDRALDVSAVNDTAALKNMETDVNAALGLARKAIVTAPYAVAPYETLATIYRDLVPYSPDSASQAISVFVQAAGKEPSNPVLPAELGKLELEQGITDSAIAHLETARALKPNYASVNFQLARAYIAAGREADALPILDQLAQESPSADIYYEQGRADFNLKRYEQAIERFGQAIVLNPLHANALYSLGLSYEALGENKEALYYYNKVADLNPDDEGVKTKVKALEGN